MSNFILVDRRKSGRGKSLPNRQKLLERIKDSIRSAKPGDIAASGVSNNTNHHVNPVKIARDALAEPTFIYERGTGEIEVVLPGNDRWLKGDRFPVSTDQDSDGAGSEVGHGDDGEDDFIVNISREEFFEVFFEDCVLPDLDQSAKKEVPEAIRKPAGFQKEGSPGQLSVIRSYRNSIGRRRALTFDDREELKILEDRLLGLMQLDGPKSDSIFEAWNKEKAEVQARIVEINNRIAAIPLFEKVDHRYRKSEQVLVKTADAVLIMAMDVSGSMSAENKHIARNFFSLQYAFIKRKYPNTDLIFIYHTDEAAEVSEEEFFTSRKNGGTTISPAIALAHKIVKERYDASLTNIYFTYAGDGDNWGDDNADVLEEFEDKGFLSTLRHAVYIQVGQEAPSWGGSLSGPRAFWTMMKSISSTSKKMHLAKITSDAEVFQEFKNIYTAPKKSRNW